MSALDKEKDTMMISHLLKGNIRDLFSYLKNFRMNPAKLVDPKGNTALQLSALNGSFGQIDFLIKFVENYYKSVSVKDWVNHKNLDGITCLHLAVFRGNYAAVELLVEKGADIHAITDQGLNMIHVAAQGDQMLLLSYFKELGLSFTMRDIKGATPLHWAAYLGCEQSSAVLISWKVQIDPIDDSGYTPLHLSSIAGNPRITRLLMLRGAKEHISDFKGRTPMDFARENEFVKIMELLRPPDLLSLCGIKPPQRPVKYRRVLMYIFIVIMAGSIWTNIGVLGINNEFYIGICFLQVCFFVIVTFKSPGYLPKRTRNLMELCKEYDSIQICPECVARRSPRSRHCQCCDMCVEKFDHHCPWINNCIGARNLGVFFIFIIISFLFLIITAYYDFLYLNIYLHTEPSLPFLSYETFIAFFWLALAVGFFFPLLMLVWVQIGNFLTNTTTNERYSRNPSSPAERSDSDDNVDRSNFYRNVTEMCCNSQDAVEKFKKRRVEKSQFDFDSLASEYEDTLSRSKTS